MPPTVIRAPRDADAPTWMHLWSGYLAFYGVSLAQAVTRRTWTRILDPAAPVFARLAEREGVVVGFAVCVLHEGTWGTEPVCYLEDLFVDPAVRGTGLGRALLDDLVARARERGWASLYWHTRADNAAARRLYDRYAAADGFVRYRLVPQPPGPA